MVLSLPVLASGEAVGMEVRNLPGWQAAISWMGVAIAVVGLLLLVGSWKGPRTEDRWLLRSLGIVVMSVGVLWQPNGGVWFFGLLAAGILIFRLLPIGKQGWLERAKSSPQPSLPTSESPSVASSVVLFLIGSALATAIAPPLAAQEEQKGVSQEVAEKVLKKPSMDTRSFLVANESNQKWEILSREQRLKGSATLTITGRPGDQFLLLRSPAVLTQFDGPGLRLSKVESANQGVAYVVTIPREEPTESRVATNPFESPESQDKESAEKGKLIPDDAKDYSVRFEYQLEAIEPTIGIPVLTGAAALQKVELSYDVGNWEVVCEAAAQVELLSEDGKENVDTAKTENSDKAKAARGSSSRFRILLGPGPALIQLRPQARDIRSEETQFFVEGAGYYAPGPGVIDGKHRLKIRTSQGRVQQLGVTIPEGLTVSSVEGPVSSWQFDAEKRRLLLQIESKTPSEFAVVVETQRSLEALPAEIELWPLRVEKAGGEVGLIALAFGTEAQPENLRADSLSLVNLGDFDVGLISHAQTVLHRVYRYGVEEGSIKVQVAPVAPEVRVQSKQVLSLGDERIVLGIQFVAEITRTGLFQLSFPLPNGLEVESLTGESLHHWSELSEQGKRQIVLHLKGKTIGPQKFTLTLAGTAPTDASEWTLPRFALNEAPRQSGEMVVQPITGIRLRTLSRQNVSEADPRAMGGQGQGALAFRLLQSDWSLQIGIEKLAPWITGNVLHDVTLREGQTRSVLLSDFMVQNAAIRTMQVKLPSLSSDVVKTLRANGETVSDFAKVEGEENLWEVRFKRRVIGPVQFQLEFERRGERAGGESLIPIEFPEVKQIGYYFAVRSGGRLEVESDKLTQGWQRIDWSSIPNNLREAGNRNAPSLALRAITPTIPLQLQVIRHSLAEALKLRVASGKLTTILSPTGDQLTSVDLTMEVIQRSSLSVQLPTGGELFSIFVNGESVHSIRQKNGNNVWQFYILPGIDDRTAQVRLVYSLNGEQLSRISLASPQLNVPLENIQWDVISPSGYLLIANEGNLELVGKDQRASYDRQSYLSSVVGKRQDQAQQAAQLLEQANQLLQTGEQGKAQWAFNNVANRNALDAASNEDARVQLENLQTQQAIVGLNTRRQRLFLDSNRGGGAVTGNEQMLQAAATNPILQQEQLNYRPQELSQLLAGNSKEENAILQQIAGRLVQHQRTTESAPQAITISLPEEGNLYRFRRSVQVAENAPLDLQLRFHSQYRPRNWQWLLLSGLVLTLSIGLAKSFRRSAASPLASAPSADPSR